MSTRRDPAGSTRGRIEWIGLRRQHRGEIDSIASAQLHAGRGIAGDHGAARAGGKRQVTLIQQEDLPLIARAADVDAPGFETLRRNLVVSGIDLRGLKHRRFRVGGQVVLEGTGDCSPCRRMEQAIGRGGFLAMRERGGITAVVHTGGMIKVGDPVAIDTDV